MRDEGFVDRYHDALLVHSLALETELDAGMLEGIVGKFAYGMLDTGGDDEVLGLVVLQDEPHTLDVVLGISPVAQTGQVAQVEAILESLGNTGCGQGDLAGNEGLATTLTLVVEEDARTAEHVVGLAILLDNPEAIELGYGIGAIGMEGSVLVLRNLLYLAIQLGGRSLIDAAGSLEMVGTDGFEDTQDTGGIHIGRELRRIKADLDVRLGCQIINLVGLNLAHHLDQRHGVAHVGIMEVEIGRTLEMSNALAIVNTTTANDAVYLITLLQKELTQVATILSGNSCNQCFLHILVLFYTICHQGFAQYGLQLSYGGTGDSHLACKPTGNGSLVLSQHLGQFALADAPTVHDPLEGKNQLHVYHNGCKIRVFWRLDKIIKNKNKCLTFLMSSIIHILPTT